MNEERFILDTSAILTFLQDEEGAERVDTILRKSEVLLPFFVPLETYYITLQEQNESVADQRYALIKQLRSTILWTVNEPILLRSARFKAHYHISLADALIAAFASYYDAILVHKDPEFEELHTEIKQEALPYKNNRNK